ncbi:hypothetical protein ACFX13_022942 [Malus domestica]
MLRRSLDAVEVVDRSRRTAPLSLQEPLVDNGSSQSKLFVAASFQSGSFGSNVILFALSTPRGKATTAAYATNVLPSSTVTFTPLYRLVIFCDPVAQANVKTFG